MIIFQQLFHIQGQKMIKFVSCVCKQLEQGYTFSGNFLENVLISGNFVLYKRIGSAIYKVLHSRNVDF